MSAYVHADETANEMLARHGLMHDRGVIRSIADGAPRFRARSVQHTNAWVALGCPDDSRETQERVALAVCGMEDP
jgi:hypothetical protein